MITALKNVDDDIKDKLIAKGVPEDEIAFIHDYDTAEKKQKLFDKMNAGEIRVLLGSTSKCGAGMKAQRKMIALHHLDCPMRPSDLGHTVQYVKYVYYVSYVNFAVFGRDDLYLHFSGSPKFYDLLCICLVPTALLSCIYCFIFLSVEIYIK